MRVDVSNSKDLSVSSVIDSGLKCFTRHTSLIVQRWSQFNDSFRQLILSNRPKVRSIRKSETFKFRMLFSTHKILRKNHNAKQHYIYIYIYKGLLLFIANVRYPFYSVPSFNYKQKYIGRMAASGMKKVERRDQNRFDETHPEVFEQ